MRLKAVCISFCKSIQFVIILADNLVLGSQFIVQIVVPNYKAPINKDVYLLVVPMKLQGGGCGVEQTLHWCLHLPTGHDRIVPMNLPMTTV